MQKVIRSIVAILVCVTPVISVAQNMGGGSPSAVNLNVREHKFKNGLRLLMVERHDTPVISSHITFNVGAVDERPGLTGVSHILEHMMFKGTTTIQTTNYEAELPLMQEMDQIYSQIRATLDKRTNSTFTAEDAARVKELRGQIDKLQEEQKKYTVQNDLDVVTAKRGFNGLNASTGNDTTQYVETFPSNQLEVWGYFESERIAHPVLREFYSEKDVVMEERRLSTDNVPNGVLGEAFDGAAYTAHPYKNPVVGWMTDLDTVSRQEVAEYFKKYYAPNNTTIVLVGDLNPDETIKLVERYFGSIPSQTAPEPVHVVEPAQHGERRTTVKFDASPRLTMGWHVPNVLHEDGPTLSVISSILTSGRTGRLFKHLVQEQQVAANANSGYQTSKYPTIFRLSGAPRNPKTLEDLEKALLAEVEKLKKEPVPDDELQKVRNQIDANFSRSLENNAGLASALGTGQVVLGDWHQIIKLNEKRRAVTAADIQRVAQKYFNNDNLTVAYMVREGAGNGPQRRGGNAPGMEK